MTTYWEDLSQDEKAALVAQRKSELEAIGRMRFPVRGTWDGKKPIKILGPAHRFPPYSDGPFAPTLGSNATLMVEGVLDGKKQRYLTMATSVEVGGKRLLSRNPPRRDPQDAWEKQLKGMSRGSAEAPYVIATAPRRRQRSDRHWLTAGTFEGVSKQSLTALFGAPDYEYTHDDSRSRARYTVSAWTIVSRADKHDTYTVQHTGLVKRQPGYDPRFTPWMNKAVLFAATPEKAAVLADWVMENVPGAIYRPGVVSGASSGSTPYTKIPPARNDFFRLPGKFKAKESDLVAGLGEPSSRRVHQRFYQTKSDRTSLPKKFNVLDWSFRGGNKQEFSLMFVDDTQEVAIYYGSSAVEPKFGEGPGPSALDRAGARVFLDWVMERVPSFSIAGEARGSARHRGRSSGRLEAYVYDPEADPTRALELKGAKVNASIDAIKAIAGTSVMPLPHRDPANRYNQLVLVFPFRPQCSNPRSVFSLVTEQYSADYSKRVWGKRPLQWTIVATHATENDANVFLDWILEKIG